MSKKAILFTLLLALLTCKGMSQELPANVREALDNTYITEDNVIHIFKGEYYKDRPYRELLINYMQGNWRYALDHLETIAPSLREKAILFRACDSLDNSEFLKYLEKTRDLRASGRLNDKEFEENLMFSYRKEGFLELNYTNPEVRAYLKSLEGFTPASMATYPADILAGRNYLYWLDPPDGTHYDVIILPTWIEVIPEIALLLCCIVMACTAKNTRITAFIGFFTGLTGIWRLGSVLYVVSLQLPWWEVCFALISPVLLFRASYLFIRRKYPEALSGMPYVLWAITRSLLATILPISGIVVGLVVFVVSKMILGWILNSPVEETMTKQDVTR